LSKSPTSREEGSLLDAWQEEGYSFMLFWFVVFVFVIYYRAQ